MDKKRDFSDHKQRNEIALGKYKEKKMRILVFRQHRNRKAENIEIKGKPYYSKRQKLKSKV